MQDALREGRRLRAVTGTVPDAGGARRRRLPKRTWAIPQRYALRMWAACPPSADDWLHSDDLPAIGAEIGPDA